MKDLLKKMLLINVNVKSKSYWGCMIMEHDGMMQGGEMDNGGSDGGPSKANRDKQLILQLVKLFQTLILEVIYL